MPGKQCGTCAFYTEKMDPREGMLLQCTKHKRVVHKDSPACEDHEEAAGKGK
jgi:hypothetical protein